MIDMTVRVLYRPEVAVLPELYRRLGQDFGERVHHVKPTLLAASSVALTEPLPCR